MCGHEVVRVRFTYSKNKGDKRLIEGCYSCTDAYCVSVYPTERRSVICKDGTSYNISPAHVRDMNIRKVAPDLKTVYRDVGRSYTFLGDK